MPVKQRAAKERIPQFGTEVLELFTRLENTPLRQRRAQWWKDGEKFLMCSLLDMGGEFWMMVGWHPEDLDERRGAGAHGRRHHRRHSRA